MTDLPPNKPEADVRDRVPLTMIVPNMITLSGMCLGLTSIRFAVDDRFWLALVLILLSALMDGLDGFFARRLNATSSFGAELDSLSDFLCFGVAPGILVYQFHLQEMGSIGWIFVLVFAAATCLRLARFNVMRGQVVEVDEDSPAKPYFQGVPAPAGALLGLMPVFAGQAGLISAGQMPLLVALWLGLVAVLMISNIPTPSPRTLRIPRRLIGVLMFALVVAIGVIFTSPWTLLVVIDLIYLGTVAVAAARHLSGRDPA